ncbi:hypothetical protein ABID22_003482 [Pontibacter aydingkolensis]|uniref:Superoxide dismutase family protein n=1 Tax=Pontibacter aydingkolensis TaxID=1911536 RepID=A0ABS7CUM8_9BACT|nr:superoxide dismutase family protein [Pontibacter aydingkolensis]MBW7467556.1 superoxide dismutase family protein [Pontibacter aydingkolensis]
MKNFLRSATSVVAACSLLVFTACESENISPDASLNAQGSQDAHRSKSYNLNKTYTADIMSLNGSGVMGTATLTLKGDMLTVNIMASGLEPNQPHPQHIHGFMDSNKNAVCPPMSADTDNDGLIELAEGAPFYGPILLSLTPFPTAPDGTINYTKTFPVTAGMLPLQNNVIVLHGMTVGNTYWPTLPVACGAIKPSNNGK